LSKFDAFFAHLKEEPFDLSSIIPWNHSPEISHSPPSIWRIDLISWKSQDEHRIRRPLTHKATAAIPPQSPVMKLFMILLTLLSLLTLTALYGPIPCCPAKALLLAGSFLELFWGHLQ